MVQNRALFFSTFLGKAALQTPQRKHKMVVTNVVQGTSRRQHRKESSEDGAWQKLPYGLGRFEDRTKNCVGRKSKDRLSSHPKGPIWEMKRSKPKSLG
jgi:hypothetical protein